MWIDGDCYNAGAFIYAFVIGSFSSMIDTIGMDKKEFDAKMRGVIQMLQFYDTPRGEWDSADVLGHDLVA